MACGRTTGSFFYKIPDPLLSLVSYCRITSRFDTNKLSITWFTSVIWFGSEIMVFLTSNQLYYDTCYIYIYMILLFFSILIWGQVLGFNTLKPRNILVPESYEMTSPQSKFYQIYKPSDRCPSLAKRSSSSSPSFLTPPESQYHPFKI